MTNHVDRGLGTSPAQLVEHGLDGLLLTRARPAGTELPEQTPPSGQAEEVGGQREHQRQEGDDAGDPCGGILGSAERSGDPVADEEPGEDVDQLEREAEEVERQRDHRVLLACAVETSSFNRRGVTETRAARPWAMTKHSPTSS